MKFTGTIEAKLDAKGRVFLPSDFRKVLAESDQGLVLKRDVYQRCLVLYPYATWEEELNALRRKFNRWDPRQAMAFRQFMAEVEMVTLDANGRFLLSKKHLQQCGLDKTVRFIGVDDRIELWSPEVADAAFLAPDELADIMNDVMTATARPVGE